MIKWLSAGLESFRKDYQTAQKDKRIGSYQTIGME